MTVWLTAPYLEAQSSDRLSLRRPWEPHSRWPSLRQAKRKKKTSHISLLLSLTVVDVLQRNRQEGKLLTQVCAPKLKHFHLCNKIAEWVQWGNSSTQLSRTVKDLEEHKMVDGQCHWYSGVIGCVSLATVGLAVWNGVLCVERWPSLSSDAEDNSVSPRERKREGEKERGGDVGSQPSEKWLHLKEGWASPEDSWSCMSASFQLFFSHTTALVFLEF